MPNPGALIVGGGPAGAAAAFALARAGLPHLLVERSREPQDILCGGFLSWRTLELVAQLGIAAEDLNPEPVRRVRLFAGGHMAEARLPKPARGVSRRRLDTLLLDRAIATGARIERGVMVRTLDGRVATIDGRTIVPDVLLLASGKHEVRGAVRPAPAVADPTLGLRARLPADPALRRLVGDAVELHLFDGGYAGLVLQEDGSANLCLAVHRSRLTVAGDPAALLARLGDRHPALGERLARAAGPLMIDAVANVPYGWRATDTEPGVFRLGDQAAVIPSLAGEGMAIALLSGLAAGTAVARAGPQAAAAAPPFQQRLARSTRRPVAVARAIRATAEEPVAAAALVMLARLAPPLVGLAARLTRISG